MVIDCLDRFLHFLELLLEAKRKQIWLQVKLEQVSLNMKLA
jgi:hypothetical protein